MAGFIMCEIRGTSMGISVDQIAKETVILGKKTKKKEDGGGGLWPGPVGFSQHDLLVPAAGLGILLGG